MCLITIATQYITDINQIPNTGIDQEVFCRFWLSAYLMWAFIDCSSYNLTIMSIERYVAIKYPLTYEKSLVRRRLPYLILFTWIIGPLLALSIPISSTVIEGECFVDTEYPSDFIRTIALAFSLCVDMLLPASIMVVLHFQMSRILKKSNQESIGNSRE